MDLTMILYCGLKGLLFMVMIFGAFLAFQQMDKGKIRTLFVGYLLFWALLLSLDVYSIITSAVSGIAIPASPPLLMLVTVITSQIVVLWFFYNLIFSLRSSFKIIVMHLAIVAVVLGLISCVDGIEVAQFFYVADSMENAYRGISSESICSKALIVVMQLLFSFVVLFMANRLIPIYQRYIEQNESNAAYNLLWIKEISVTLFVITSAYIYLMVFITYTNAIIYYIVVIVAYMRMINILIQHVALDDIDELYDKLGVKWSWRKMWYVEEAVSQELSVVRAQFNEIIKWVKSERPYINPQFSYKDIAVQFDGITFNDFDTLVSH